MKKISLLILLIICNLIIVNIVYAQDNNNNNNKKLPPLFGNVEEQYQLQKAPTGYIKDAFTGDGIDGAKVSIPDKGISTTTNSDGSFNLNIEGQQGNFILSVKKDGYLPFALNAKIDDFSKPFELFVEQLQGQIVIDSEIHHLGDNNFSQYSANASSFKLPSEGATYLKEFYIESIPKKQMIIKIGSIIGLDTMASRQLGQSNIDTYSSPLGIFVNSIKIAEIAINADNKEIPIPTSVLKPHSNNLLVIQTGVNQALRYSNSIDYDDIEFLNLILEQK